MAEEVKEIMIALQEEFPLDLVTSNRESIIRPYLERSSVPGLFRAILGEEMHESKHEKIEHLLQEYELQKEEVLFVTDTTGDIHEARLAGVESVAVTYGFHSRSWLEKEKPAWIIDDLCELRGIVGQSRGTYSK